VETTQWLLAKALEYNPERPGTAYKGFLRVLPIERPGTAYKGPRIAHKD
jgi:hypothetical protein